jgi:hypothetical protein
VEERYTFEDHNYVTREIKERNFSSIERRRDFSSHPEIAFIVLYPRLTKSM